MLEKRKRMALANITNLRQSVRQVKSHKKQVNKKKHASSSDQEQPQKQIQLQEVNQQTLFYQHMIQLKEKELIQVKNKMQKALSVQKQVGRLVKQQGQKIDIIEQNVQSARSNVQQSGKLLVQAKKDHISANKKKFCIIGIIFVILLIILIPIIVTQA